MKSRRIILKIGSGVLITPEGKFNKNCIIKMAKDIVSAHRKGEEIILITSGAIAAGTDKLKWKGKPLTLPEKQAAAAVGQTRLMRVYKDAFRRLGVPVAQVLLTYDDLDSRLRCRNATNTINALLNMNVVPIVNENDTVAVEEIKFGDNDYLSELVFEFLSADLLVLLTDVEGVLKDVGAETGESQVVSSVCRKTWVELELGVSDAANDRGAGGMRSKIQSARAAVELGGVAVIANGRAERVLERILAGEKVGTLFTDK